MKIRSSPTLVDEAGPLQVVAQVLLHPGQGEDDASPLDLPAQRLERVGRGEVDA